MNNEAITDYEITPHAAFEMKRRGMSNQVVEQVLINPEQRMDVRSGRIVLQSRISMGGQKKTYLVRVFVDVDKNPAQVVTVYRTGKITKYWRE
ncbi:MAG: hypothetical protein IEMM0002_1189 [bacterium]|nr:MAG: hypothetical protein IEMM0002_1189 [bacterium]